MNNKKKDSRETMK